ncbi:MAG: carbohydrate porin [Verrucomicrobia bacterium]|nr:carbohydrate porin [Verrucomicrobiota bacterium]
MIVRRVIITVGWCLAVSSGWADHAGQAAKPNSPTSAEATADAPKTLWERDTLTGDWGGTRARWSEKGFDVGMEYTGEFLANASGGVRQGALYQGLLKPLLDFDLEKMSGWKGGKLHVSGLWIHGTEPNSRGDIAGMAGTAFMEISGISAFDTYRLYELWFEQKFLDDKLFVRVGQLALDEEFVASDDACLFFNAACGWPVFLSATVPSGGAGYPVAGTGARVRYEPTERLSLAAAVLEGDVGEQSSANRTGTQFRLDDDEGVFAIFEAAYRLNQEKNARGLPGTYKLGGWYHSGRFDDLGFDTQGVSLAESGGIPLTHRGNGGIYVDMDQMVWREKAGTDEGLGVFCRVAPWLPDDRNPIDFYAGVGLVYRGLIPGRDQDLFGVAANYARVSGAVRDLQRAANAVAAAGGTPSLDAGPIPDYEMAVEVTYQIVLTPWWSLQPDFQYIFHPGGSKALKNAVVAGLRTQISF